jgi:hypothetical protein
VIASRQRRAPDAVHIAPRGTTPWHDRNTQPPLRRAALHRHHQTQRETVEKSGCRTVDIDPLDRAAPPINRFSDSLLKVRHQFARQVRVGRVI